MRPDGVVAARDADYAAMTWYPADPRLDRWLAVYRAVAHGNGAEPDAGRRLLAWARAAGAADTGDGLGVVLRHPRGPAWWGGMWADRILKSAITAQAVDGGHADEAELHEISAAWRSGRRRRRLVRDHPRRGAVPPGALTGPTLNRSYADGHYADGHYADLRTSAGPPGSLRSAIPTERTSMTIVDTGCHRPDRDRLIAVRRDPAAAWRSKHLDRKIQYARRHGAELPSAANQRQVDRALERIFKEPDFLHSRWLADGAKRCDAVARLVTPVELGTGFLASPWLLVTNNHVLTDPGAAADTEVTFRYEEDARGRTTRAVKVRLEPDRCFLTSPVDELDFTVVAVSAVKGKAPGKTFGSIPMVGATGKILSGTW